MFKRLSRSSLDGAADKATITGTTLFVSVLFEKDYIAFSPSLKANPLHARFPRIRLNQDGSVGYEGRYIKLNIPADKGAIESSIRADIKEFYLRLIDLVRSNIKTVLTIGSETKSLQENVKELIIKEGKLLDAVVDDVHTSSSLSRSLRRALKNSGRLSPVGIW